MAKNKPTSQHYVPQCYLMEWVDPLTPKGYEPYVWIFAKDGKNRRRKAPGNIFKQNNLYTLNISGVEKNYAIEQTLSKLENQYVNIFRNKIKNNIPLNEYEHIILCAFVAAMLQRTLRHKDTLEKFYDDIIERTESLEVQHNLKPTESQRLKKLKEDTHKLTVVRLLPDLTQLLLKMSVAFLCVDKANSKFITSDDPCNLFNPDLQWQRFLGPGLAQDNVQLTLPLSPKIMLCMTWVNLKGYIKWDKKHVEESNRMIAGYCYKYFVSNGSRLKRMWLRRYPLDFFFILKIIGNEFKIWRYKVNRKYLHHVNRK